MSAFVDTSALVAILNSRDPNAAPARAIWERLLRNATPLDASNYIVVEATALVQHRLGMSAVRTLHDDVLPLITVHWVSEAIHASALIELLDANRRRLSLVDCVSFVVMRQLGIEDAFAFDQHFTEQGFNVLTPV